jgi:hypothetical protein
MTNLLVWILLVGISAFVFVVVIRADRSLDRRRDALERRMDALENILIEDVLDAVDNLCFPLDDFERETVKMYVKGEYKE